ncbi:MAG: DUF4124 domain-containing protein [Gammaproteobacteria bacterium]|nr:DUF4124 domain-containing protein [Gammaproteobacteria bacterium]NNF60134.1 DUF4124 domain-containing protein [Gammaproteobacteria bacterium]NNM21546.1 DUF4124 domain-containing protein [Gammaproteobacteria bacterium]
MRTIVLIFIIIASAATAETTLYRWVDEQGRVHYSDRPRAEAEQVQIREPMSYTERRPQAPPADVPDAQRNVESTASFAGYNSVGVNSPTEDQVLWNIGGTLPVTLSVQPQLQQGHSIQVYFNGAQAADWPAASTSYTLENIYRGTHTLAVSIVDGSGNEIAVSEPVSFHVKQSSTLN